jgi:hypothetical protein
MILVFFINIQLHISLPRPIEPYNFQADLNLGETVPLNQKQYSCMKERHHLSQVRNMVVSLYTVHHHSVA